MVPYLSILIFFFSPYPVFSLSPRDFYRYLFIFITLDRIMFLCFFRPANIDGLIYQGLSGYINLLGLP